MTIRARVMDALKNVGIPVYFGGWHPATAGEQPPNTYMTFTTMSNADTHTDDVRTGWRHYVYLTLWAKGAYSKDGIITAMETAGFDCGPMNEGMETDTGMNMCAMTWEYREVI